MRTARCRSACGLWLVVGRRARRAVRARADRSGRERVHEGVDGRAAQDRRCQERHPRDLSGLQDGSVVALRYYGHRVRRSRRTRAARTRSWSSRFSRSTAAACSPRLTRPCRADRRRSRYSLEQAAGDFGGASDEERGIILVSDGVETCGGDPLATVRGLQARGIKVKIHTIGFDVDAAARAQLEAISQATGGEYHDARNAAALADSLRQLTAARAADRAQFRVTARRSAAATPTTMRWRFRRARPTSSITTSARTTTTTSPSTAHDGQKIVAAIQAHDRRRRHQGRQIQGARARRYSGIALHAPDKQRIDDDGSAAPGAESGDRAADWRRTVAAGSTC